MSNCKSCGAPIEWVETVTGKSMPLDLESCDGNILVADGSAVVVGPGNGDRLSHFVTCPNAKQHRKP